MSTFEDRARALDREELIERNYREAMRLRELKARRSEIRGEIFANSVSNFGAFSGRPATRFALSASRLGLIVGGYGLAAFALYSAFWA